jgi:lipid-binding SYLF domain-containing protein
MNAFIRLVIALLMVGGAALTLMGPGIGHAADKAQIDRDVQAALQKLYVKTPSAKLLAGEAKAILVFPSIVKGGFVVGGQYGEGALVKQGKIRSYYKTVSASYGLQAGLQKFGYALFFMNESALTYLNTSGGWEVGFGPSIVIVDAGVAKSITTTTTRKEVYAFFFDQKGLMAGLSLQGTKISRIYPK